MMIKKKIKFISSVSIIYLFIASIIGFNNVYAMDYDSDIFIKISSLNNNKKGLITGYLNNSLSFDSISLDVNILFNDDSYIYSLEEKEYVLAIRGSGGISYHGDTYLISFGLLDSVASKNFYNKLFLIPNYYFGVKALSRLKKDKGDHYTLTGSYIENNTSLSALFLKNFLDETLYIGVSITPSMEYFLSHYKDVHYSKDISAVDSTIIYYNEYQTLGYGFDVALRQYIDVDHISYYYKDFTMGISLDYFGLSYKSHFLVGDNPFYLNRDQVKNYKSFENSIYYTFSAITIGGYYLNTKISTLNTEYDTDMLEFNLSYQLGKYFCVYSAIFYQDFKIEQLSNNIGLLIGMSLSI